MAKSTDSKPSGLHDASGYLCGKSITQITFGLVVVGVWIQIGYCVSDTNYESGENNG